MLAKNSIKQNEVVKKPKQENGKLPKLLFIRRQQNLIGLKQKERGRLMRSLS